MCTASTFGDLTAPAAASPGILWLASATMRAWCRRSWGVSSTAYNGKGVHNVAEGKPAKWKLKADAD
jgi:hypothetical protein